MDKNQRELINTYFRKRNIAETINWDEFFYMADNNLISKKLDAMKLQPLESDDIYPYYEQVYDLTIEIIEKNPTYLKYINYDNMYTDLMFKILKYLNKKLTNEKNFTLNEYWGILELILNEKTELEFFKYIKDAKY